MSDDESAERLFAHYLAEEEDGVAPPFEEWCARHPEQRAALEEKRARHRALKELWPDFVAVREVSPHVLPSAEARNEQREKAEQMQRTATDELQNRDFSARYRVGAELGRGGMGCVLDVWDKGLRRNLAMKVIGAGEPTDRTRSVDPRSFVRFLEEAQITGRLDHPAIVPVHDLGIDDDGRAFYTMKRVEGLTFKEVIARVSQNRDGWTQARALDVLLRACEAVAYAHEKGVVHRDLKPANIMVEHFGAVYVMDWGLARPYGNSKSDIWNGDKEAVEPDDLRLATLEVLGTPLYMAPEQARGEGSVRDPRADVYSMGSILYHLLSGRRPYAEMLSGVDRPAILELVQDQAPTPLERLAPKTAPELVAICEKAMARKSADRYADAGELAADLRAFLEGRVVRAYAVGAMIELRKWVGRNKALTATVLAAVVVSVTATVVTVVSLSEATKTAEAGRRVAEDARQLSLVVDLRALFTRQDQMWPIRPELTPGYEDWLVDARALVERRPDLVKRMDELSAAEFDDQLKLAWYEELTKILTRLDSLTDPESGLIAGVSPEFGWGVERRLEYARRVETETVSGSTAAALWADAAEDIADSALYRDLELSPQIGLLPIGRDPDSGLWEFALVETGELPHRNAQTDRLELFEGMALVFVLIPGGTFTMGAQLDSALPNFDESAQEHEAPLTEIELEPFFLSKYEMTQGQWVRITGANAATYSADAVSAAKTDLSHPVESVNWVRCQQVLRWMGLVLPTEAQWEYAARAGTTTPWSTGAERNSLEGAANLADQAAARINAPWATEIQDWPELDDGFAVHAPVGSFRPNPFGLHDVHGNVFEWCRDRYGPYTFPPRAGDGFREHPDSVKHRVARGGAHSLRAWSARSSRREGREQSGTFAVIGVRPARAVEH